MEGARPREILRPAVSASCTSAPAARQRRATSGFRSCSRSPSIDPQKTKIVPRAVAAEGSSSPGFQGLIPMVPEHTVVDVLLKPHEIGNASRNLAILAPSCSSFRAYQALFLIPSPFNGGPWDDVGTGQEQNRADSGVFGAAVPAGGWH